MATRSLRGVSGTNAARMAAGLEASVIIIDRSIPRLKELDLQFGARATTLFATAHYSESSRAGFTMFARDGCFE